MEEKCPTCKEPLVKTPKGKICLRCNITAIVTPLPLIIPENANSREILRQIKYRKAYLEIDRGVSISYVGMFDTSKEAEHWAWDRDIGYVLIPPIS